MTLSNHERVHRCRLAVADYSDEDDYTNFVDFLADGLHWCRANEHSFRNALGTALMHFSAETNSNEKVKLNHQSTNERNDL